jgi:hypothetical protein
MTLKDQSAEFMTRVRSAALDGLFIGADETAGLIAEHIQRDTPSGRTYKKYNPKRTHKASAPGEYPATDLGHLANSMGPERDNEAAYIVSTAKHAVYLELGHNKRPFITRGVLENSERIAQIVETLVKRQTHD